MTRKESYLYELLSAKNIVKELRNEPKLDVEEYSKTYAFASKAKKSKMNELENEMNNVIRQIEAIKQEKAREAWFETEEGKAYKAEKEQKLEELRQQWKATRDAGLAHVREVVRELLGEGWDVTAFSDRSMEIALVKEYREDSMPVAHFGHEFDVSFGRSFSGCLYEWEMNYGTLGSFVIEKDEKRTKYLVGMAKFASDTEVVPALRDYLHNMTQQIDDIRMAYSKVERELGNPFKK